MTWRISHGRGRAGIGFPRPAAAFSPALYVELPLLLLLLLLPLPPLLLLLQALINSAATASAAVAAKILRLFMP